MPDGPYGNMSVFTFTKSGGIKRWMLGLHEQTTEEFLKSYMCLLLPWMCWKGKRIYPNCKSKVVMNWREILLQMKA